MCVKGKEGKYRDYLACERKGVKPVVRFSILQQVSCTYPGGCGARMGCGRSVKGKKREKEEGGRVE